MEDIASITSINIKRYTVKSAVIYDERHPYADELCRGQFVHVHSLPQRCRQGNITVAEE